jgi:endonuclease III
MVRQDKISYIITCFNSEGWFELPEQESITDFLNARFQEPSLTSEQYQFLTQEMYIPDDELYQYLTNIDGIDEDCAKHVLCYGYNRDIFPVDDSINRVLCRTGVVPTGKSNDEIYHSLGKYIPVERSKFLHTNLNKVSELYCDEHNPKCASCFFQEHCDFAQAKNDWRIEH